MNREIIEKVLLNCGMAANRLGFKYIVEATIVYSGNDNIVWKDVYKEVAAKFQEKEESVYANIKSALRQTRNDVANYDMIDKYLGWTNESPSSSISRLFHRITEDENDELNKNEINEELIKKLIKQTLLEMIMSA